MQGAIAFRIIELGSIVSARYLASCRLTRQNGWDGSSHGDGVLGPDSIGGLVLLPR